jgi:hypothetical protein
VEYDWDADKLGLAIESMEVPDTSLLHSEVFSLTDMVPGAMAIDLICRREFDLSIVEYANGKPLNEILGISYKDLKGVIQHNPDHPQLTQEQRRKTPQRFLAPFWSAATSSIPLISIPGPTLRRSSATLSPRTEVVTKLSSANARGAGLGCPARGPGGGPPDHRKGHWDLQEAGRRGEDRVG